MLEKKPLIIFDTTLRDGEQSPGVTLTVDEKVEIAKQLSRLGVDVCEAGFPIASDGDFKAVRRIAEEVGSIISGRKDGLPMVICALARATKGDIQRAYEAIRTAPRHRIHTFLATSDIHLEYKLKIDRAECIKRSVDAVLFIKSLGVSDIEFSPEDAGRSDRAFLVKVLRAVVAAGATTLNIPDTVGYNTPEEYGDLIRYLVQEVDPTNAVFSFNQIIFSTHCHNDLGLATANTLSGVRNGAQQVEVTINGIGERAGNTALEEIVMAIHTHPNYYPQIYNTSRLVTQKTGMLIQSNKAIVGANAFAHESGIHQDGMLKNKSTYEIIEPEILGIPSKALVLGKHSGRNAFKTHILSLIKDTVYSEMLEGNEPVFESLFEAFKKLADGKKSGISDQDIFGLLDVLLNNPSATFTTYDFQELSIMSGSKVLSTATVTITKSGTGESVTDAAIGSGAVNAIFNAISRAIDRKNILASYDVSAVSEGSDSPGQVTVRIRQIAEGLANSIGSKDDSSTIHIGRAVDKDILVASCKAYINAVNRMIHEERRYVGKNTRNVNL